MNKACIVATILILLLITGCVKNQMNKLEVSKWCTDYVSNKQIMKPSDNMTDQEIYEQCMEIYGYGKNN